MVRGGAEAMKICILATLMTAPVVLFAAAGVRWTLEHSLVLPACVVTAGAWGLALVLLRRWLHRAGSPEQVPSAAGARDREALAIVKRHEESLKRLTPEQLADRSTQEQIFSDLALDLARHYHPDAADPLSPLTAREVLMAARSLIDDAEQWLDYYLPGNQTLTIGQWQQLGRMPRWLGRLAKSKSGPPPNGSGNVEATTRAPRHAGLAIPGKLQAVLLRKLGSHLIRLYGGHLDDRSDRRERPPEESTQPTRHDPTIAVLGAPGSGKTTLIEVLLGSRRASKDRLPHASGVHRYRVQLGRPLARLTVLETDLAREAGVSEWQSIAPQSDLVLLVCPATGTPNEAAAIIRMLLGDGSRAPVITVLTHTDQGTDLDPWQAEGEPELPQQHRVTESARLWQTELEPLGTEVVPVCLDLEHDRVFGVHQWLVPALAKRLSEQQAHVFLQAIAPGQETPI
jgi:hypothetical protein